MILIDGKKVSAEVRNRLAEETKILKEKTGKEPGLATVLVGDDPASETYINAKIKKKTKKNEKKKKRKNTKK